MKHHTCQSDRIEWVKYDPEMLTMQIAFRPKGTVYEYAGVPEHHFTNVTTALTRDEAIGPEKPKSEGSYLIHHVIGVKGQPTPYPFQKIETTREIPA